MSMSDCVMCWDTPCTCGYEYRLYSKKRRLEQAAVVLGIPTDQLAEAVKDLLPGKHPMCDGKPR